MHMSWGTDGDLQKGSQGEYALQRKDDNRFVELTPDEEMARWTRRVRVLPRSASSKERHSDEKREDSNEEGSHISTGRDDDSFNLVRLL